MDPAGIVIGAAPDGSGWLDDLLNSLRTTYPVVVDRTWDFELHSIELGAKRFEEFVFLPYSTVILDNGLWPLVFEAYKGESVSLCQYPGPFGMYLGKYLAPLVQQVGCPVVPDKLKAVNMELEWGWGYAAATKDESGEMGYVALGDLPHSATFVPKHGRTNMMVQNRWLRRYKGSWDGESLTREMARLARIRGTE
jgi:hypothetical protein